MGIVVTYMPADEVSPLPNNMKEYTFESHVAFKEWVLSYVCGTCLIDFEDFYNKVPETLEDWLSMGCGCEIRIEDKNNMVYWNDGMT